MLFLLNALVIFLDDLQWMDLASIHLLKTIIASQERGYLLLIGAYRDNEVDAGHPMMTAVEAIRKTGAKVDTITLSPLKVSHVNQMFVDTLCCSGDTAMPLAELVERKTGGNPFFVTRFLNTLYEEGLLSFNFDGRRWQWDLDTIHNVDITDNVVDLMVRKIRKYPDTTQHALRLAACIGNQFDLRTLSTIHGKSGEETSGDLWDAVKDGLVIGVGDWGSGVRDRGIGVGDWEKSNIIPDSPSTKTHPPNP